jgi:hypothetical protein
MVLILGLDEAGTVGQGMAGGSVDRRRLRDVVGKLSGG